MAPSRLRPSRRHRIRRRFLLLLIFSLLVFLFFSYSSYHYSHSSTNLAYFIQISPSTLSLLPRLLTALYHPSNCYILHYDLRISPNATRNSLVSLYRAFSSISTLQPNIHLCPREAVTYRGISLTLNYLTGIQSALESCQGFDFFINLSAADFPTASQSIIHQLLSSQKGRNFIDWKPHSEWGSFVNTRLGGFYIDTAIATVDHAGIYIQPEGNGSISNPIVKHLGYPIAKGSAWMILSKDFCEYVMKDGFARKLLTMMSYSDASDEHYFATLLWNGWLTTTVGDNLRNIYFIAPNGSFAIGQDGKRRRQHPFWVDERGENGEWLFWEMLWKKPGFFTRKVRDEDGFREKVEIEMIGIGEEVMWDSVKKYERILKSRFDKVVGKAKKEVVHYE